MKKDFVEAPADTTWTGFSLAERDYRWNRVRSNAATAGLDAVLVPLCVDGRNLRLSLEQARGTRSDGRFLTMMENAAVVLPTDGRPPIVINDRGEGNAWVPEARPVSRGGRGSWAAAMADALLEFGLERARIGVSGLGQGTVTHGRAGSGVVNHSAYTEVARRLPNARFEDATDVVGFARYVKSEEQIDALRRGAAIAAMGIEEMVAAARPGAREATVYARVMGRMLSLGSEYYPLAFYSSGPGEPHLRFENPPIDRVLGPSYLITNETDAVWGGLIAQELQPIFLGPIPEEWKPAIEMQRDLFYGGMELMKPGGSFGQLIEFTNSFGRRRGLDSLILMHGRGYGDDGPLLTPQDREYDHIRDVTIEQGTAWVWKPIAYSADRQFQFSWGGCVVVTERGVEQLVQRTPGMVSVA
jgi:Xaa-Pro aminopeptidase